MINISSFEELKNLNRTIVLFGAGTFGKHLCAELLSSSVPKERLLFCDNYKSGMEEKNSVKIISFKELCLINDPIVIITIESEIKRSAVFEQIKEANFSSDIIDYLEIVSIINRETNGGWQWNDLEKMYDWTCHRESLSEIARWIDKDDKSVIDFSAGEAYLKELLPPGVTYTATDCIARKPDFVVYDYNKDKFPDIHTDVSVLNQMLYYANDINSFLNNVCNCTSKKIIVGFNVKKDVYAYSKYNNNSINDIIDIIQINGFELRKKVIKNVGDGSITHEWLLLFERI